jgi:preprotein translocase subunit SecE
MAKNISKQGKKANKKSGQQTADKAQRPLAPGEKVAKEQAQPAKGQSKPSEKAEKSAKDQAKSSKKEQPKGSKEQKGSRGGKTAPKKDSIFKKILTYFKNVRLEVKRTTWPSREEVLRMSLIVVGALIFFGVFIFLIDWVMNTLMPQYASLGGSTPPVDPAAIDPTAVDPSAVDPATTDPGTTDPGTADPSATPDATPDTGTTE